MKAYILLMRGKRIVSCLWYPKPHAASLDELFAKIMTEMNDPVYAQHYGDWDTLVVKLAPSVGVDGPIKRGKRVL